MNRLEIVFESEERVKIERVKEVLALEGLEYKSAKRLDIKRPIPKQQKKGCCGQDKEGEKQSPSLLQKGKNLITSTAEHFMTGMKHVEPDVFLERLTICKACTSRREGFICAECGCYMGIKASWAEQKCESNKW